jgi:DNA helicase IV
MTQHPELDAEQAYIDRAYARLDEMRAAVTDRMHAVLDQSTSTTPSEVVDRDVIVRTSLARLEQLQIGEQSLCFGRIDNDMAEIFYIGRLAISDEEQEPLVVDWRAPVAEPFYRATPREPMGLLRRRHFQARGRALQDIEDEDFELTDHTSDANVSQTLFAALEQRRTGVMRDIVATIQREQDDIIRAPMQGVMVVQGAPGTGKTAVALHRAAYLLYTYRFPLERQGVLVVGPNPIFMRYIAHVLPSLGETGVAMSSISDLFSGADVRGVDSHATEKIKGDSRMVAVLVNAVHDRQRGLRRDLVVPYGSRYLRVSSDRSRELVNATKRRRGTHNAKRRHLQLLLAAELRAMVRRESDDALFEVDAERLLQNHPEDIGEFWEDIRDESAIIDALDRMWPLLRPTELLHDLFGATALISSASKSLLNADEQEALYRPRSARFDDIAWTTADMALLDEARVLLGARKRGGADPDDRAFGHIVVDEAQDLSPMQLRMIARRSISGSMTVVGDIGQASGAWVPSSWYEVIRQLDHEREGSVVELSVNYRTPAEVMEVANRVLQAAAPHLEPARAIRHSGIQPRFISTTREQSFNELHRQVEQLILEADGGLIGIIIPQASLEHVEAELINASETIGVYTLATAKGLEFDAVLVFEPQLIVEETVRGLSALYVALTRTTRLLTILHSGRLPESLRPSAVDEVIPDSIIP